VLAVPLDISLVGGGGHEAQLCRQGHHEHEGIDVALLGQRRRGP
jgi:hypothetical protein